MGRPAEYDEARRTTAIRLPVSLHDDLRDAARAYGLSMNRMMEQAITEFLTDLPLTPPPLTDRLAPPDPHPEEDQEVAGP